MSPINPGASALIRTLYDQALLAVKPDHAVRNAITMDGNALVIGDHRLALPASVHLIAIGKAAIPMTRGAFDVLGDRVDTAFALTKHGHGFGLDDPRLRVYEASHPVPDESTIRGTEALLEQVARFAEDDVVLFLISGGGSAILESPIAGVSLEDMATVTRLLLQAGAPIQDLNAVRTPLSRVKGSGLRHATPVRSAATLLLSDVLGNDPGVIASGPTVPSKATWSRALGLLEHYQLLEAVPKSVLAALQTPGQEPADKNRDYSDVVEVIADNDLAIAAIIRYVEGHDLHVRDIWHGVEGEARERGRVWVDEIERQRLEPAILIGGGETTVTVKGDGLGGRNSEFVVAAADRLRELQLSGWTVASLATDGEDALTAAAGGIANAASAANARDAGDHPAERLAANDSFSWLQRWGEVVVPGPTGTNVNDLYFAVPDTVLDQSADTD